MRKIVDELQKKLPKGLASLNCVGRWRPCAQFLRGLGIGLIMSIVLVYLLIVVNFQSWLDPFIIITALPGALAGIVWILLADSYHVERAVPDRLCNVYGRGDSQQHSGDFICS